MSDGDDGQPPLKRLRLTPVHDDHESEGNDQARLRDVASAMQNMEIPPIHLPQGLVYETPPMRAEASSASRSGDVVLPRDAETGGEADAVESMENPVAPGEDVVEPMDTAAMDESKTDNEEPIHQSARAIVNELAPTTEMDFADLERLLFVSFRDQLEPKVERILDIVKKHPHGSEYMRRLVRDEDETGLTLLMIAVRHGMMNMCVFLLDEGADVNQVNEKRPYALLLAAQKGHEEATRLLLQRGANAESKNMALIPAAHFGHLKVVQILLDFNADQNYSNRKGTTPLMRAAQEGRDEVVHFLIQKGAIASSANNEGMTALMLAAQRGHARIATMLIKSGSDVNTQTRQGSTALLLAAKRGHTDTVEALLTAGADIFLKDDRNKTAAETAHRRGHLDVFFKITVSNQLRLMREALRRERFTEIMRLSQLYSDGRAKLGPSIGNSTKLAELYDRTLTLPRPLLASIARFLPLCHLWERRLTYLHQEAASQPTQAVRHSILIMDEVLFNVGLGALDEMKLQTKLERSIPALHEMRRLSPSGSCGHLALLRDHSEFRRIFTDVCKPPLCPDLLTRLYRMADLQGVLNLYPGNNAILFTADVAQDVVAVLSELLKADTNWRRARTDI
ncbi:hypothetical protein Poli38472_014332 [Pythium oligandrum]|uniref:Uncharacterized protein n=1 Tax=Pythium oligandrum TaxID=41045 RepID=A0A8K1C6X4_PYTOL|nr:hypothetical protein Poli38472_014332 [Pythium oligandrum]|eukprot:TMW57729.1 hypothetical protein Poli38472_014332 [Pythium oligandrum]